MSRKGENIYKRKDGRWEGRMISGYTQDGKAKYTYVYVKTYNEAKKKLNEARVSQVSISESNRQAQQDLRTFSYFSDEWLNRKLLTVKYSTYIRYNQVVERHIKPMLGVYPMNQITTEMIDSFVHLKLKEGRLDKSGGLSEKTVLDMLLVIKEILNFAQRNGVNIICSPAQISLRNKQKEMRVLSVVEEEKLLKVLTDAMNLEKLGIYLCLFTGFRIGELCALQWKNISIEDKTLYVGKTVQRLQNKDFQSERKTKIIISEPKSFSGLRVIPLPDFLISVLLPFKGEAESFVLSGKTNKIIEPRTMQNYFKKYLVEAGIKDANFHSLRHTFATRCIEKGFDIKSLSEVLGHSSVKMTMERYVHSSMELKRVNMEKLNDIIKS